LRDAGGRGDETGVDAHRGRLAGAVRAEKADDLAATNLEGDVVERAERPISLGEAVSVDQHVGGQWTSNEERLRKSEKKCPLCGVARRGNGLPSGFLPGSLLE